MKELYHKKSENKILNLTCEQLEKYRIFTERFLDGSACILIILNFIK
ncbi:hypothetical protein [Ilyobacter sp.]